MKFTFSDDHAKLIFAEYISSKIMGGQRVAVDGIKQGYDGDMDVEALVGEDAEKEEANIDG